LALLKWAGFGLLALALFLSVVAFRSDSKPADAEGDVTVPSYELVVAARMLAPGHEITATDLELAKRVERPDDAFEATEGLIGRTPALGIEAGGVLREASLTPLSALTRALREGETAVAVSIDRVTGLGGFVRPGDAVDVLFLLRRDGREITKTHARTLLVNVRVLAFGEKLEDESPNEPTLNARTAVLAVREQDAPLLLLADVVGKLRLAVRAKAPGESVERLPAASLSELLQAKQELDAESPDARPKGPGIPIIRGSGIQRSEAR